MQEKTLKDYSVSKREELKTKLDGIIINQEIKTKYGIYNNKKK